jgi:hypothetical protein
LIEPLNREINAGLADPNITPCRGGVTVLSGSRAEFGKLIADETEKWAKVIKFAGPRCWRGRAVDESSPRARASTFNLKKGIFLPKASSSPSRGDRAMVPKSFCFMLAGLLVVVPL